MISFKVSVAIKQPVEMKAKLKVDTDSLETVLPFDELIVEAIPANMEDANFQIRITNATKIPSRENSLSESVTLKKPFHPKQKHWWQRFWPENPNPDEGKPQSFRNHETPERHEK